MYKHLKLPIILFYGMVHANNSIIIFNSRFKDYF
jgi:hypothetical protein